MKFCIKTKETLPKAIRRIAAEQLKLAKDETSAQKSSAESIHCARKAIKRARAVLRLMRCGDHDAAARREDRALGDAARLLAAERDIHVQWAALKSLPICGKSGVCNSLRQKLLEAEADLRPKKKAQVSEFNAAIKTAQTRLAQWPSSDVDKEQLASALKRSYQRTRKRFKRVCEVATATKLHRWRKAAKAFWYQLQLTEVFASKKLKRLAEKAEDLTDYLGDDHDLFLLSRELAGAKDSQSLAVREELRNRRSKLQKCALRLARKTFDLAPSEFHKQISRCLNQATN
jgi:CHAD domain-containing protein